MVDKSKPIIGIQNNAQEFNNVNPKFRKTDISDLSRPISRLISDKTNVPDKTAPVKMTAKPSPEDLVELQACTLCARKFRPEALEKHSKVCKNVFVNKRQVFDTNLMRKTDEQIKHEQNNFHHKDYNQSNSLPQIKKKIPKWKLQSEQFRRALKVDNNNENVPKELQIDTDERVQCPTCGRKFNSDVLQRHQNFCAEKLNNKFKVGKVKNM